MSVDTMLIGTDFSEVSVQAVDHAAEYAAKLGYQVELVNVVEQSHKRAPLDSDSAEEALEEIAGKLRADYNLTVDTATYPGNPGRVLAKLSQADRYAMVAIGFTGKTGLLTRMGSVASKTVRLVDKPILVPVPNHNPNGPVIGCIDFSDETGKVNCWTHTIAHITDKEPVFVHVAAPFEVILTGAPHLGGIGMTESVLIRLGTTEKSYRANLEASVRHRLGVEPDRTVDILLDNFPAQTIAKYATEKKASLVVMGRHGHNTLGARIMGTTAEHVFGASECSTLIIP